MRNFRLKAALCISVLSGCLLGACKSTQGNDAESDGNAIIPLKPGTKMTRVVKIFAIDPDLREQLANEFRDTMRFAQVEREDKSKALALYFRRDGAQIESAIYFQEKWLDGGELVNIEVISQNEATKEAVVVGSAYYDSNTKAVTLTHLCTEDFYDVCDIDYQNGKINFKLNQ